MPPPAYGKLRETFLLEFTPGEVRGTGRDSFYHWVRHARNPPIEVSEEEWSVFKAGGAVRWEMIEAYSEYISDVLRLGTFPTSRIAEAADSSPETIAARRERLDDVWQKGWGSLLGWLRDEVTFSDRVFCRDEAEVVEAATMIVRCAGRLVAQDDSIADDRAQRIGEELMHRSRDEYAAWLLRFWRLAAHTVLFAVNNDERVGASVVIPLTDEAYLRFRNGAVHDGDLTPNDMQHTSSRLLFHALAREPRTSPRGRLQLGLAQVHTGTYQLAHLCEPVWENRRCPRFLSFAANAENESKASNYGFRDIGTKLQRTGFRVLELAPPGANSLTLRDYLKAPKTALRSACQYTVMLSVLMAYQSIFANEIYQRRVEAD